MLDLQEAGHSMKSIFPHLSYVNVLYIDVTITDSNIINLIFRRLCYVGTDFVYHTFVQHNLKFLHCNHFHQVLPNKNIFHKHL